MSENKESNCKYSKLNVRQARSQIVNILNSMSETRGCNVKLLNSMSGKRGINKNVILLQSCK